MTDLARLRFFWTLIFLVCFPVLGFSHAGNVSYSQITVENLQIRHQIEILLEELEEVIPLDTDRDGVITSEELEAVRDELADYLARKVEVESWEVAIPLRLESLEIREREVIDADSDTLPFLWVELIFDSPHLLSQFKIRCHVLDEVDVRHDNLAKITVFGVERPFVFKPWNTFVYERGRGRAEQVFPSLWSTLHSFGMLGGEHILTGYDHMLFLIGLLLVATRFLTTVKVVTAFTVAHSVALVLAAFKLVEVSVGIVEPMIALSIMYVAAENFFSWFPLKRWMISFGFGLIHGLAFAQGLQMLDLPRTQFAIALLSFNVGIELAQVMIVAVAFPALMLMARAPWRDRTIRVLSLVLFVMGTVWLVERVLW
ncbi:MAG: HupE/UreJ family protein [Acidobacteriota bacterium]